MSEPAIKEAMNCEMHFTQDESCAVNTKFKKKRGATTFP